ncbi:1-phosphofructokinase [Cellulomonas rhizosphaerae]|uniref:1-phosphofructokinase n=1 Tax=Cellulomonas rhizosphaerae TaxID=2293719 RepID=A0A413RPE7_9CELL|nr:1-phosphofructokinase [Cellulomonas rhizosphaerae]RHA43835.1 1-phosphofructokinase [Cellulomonas rhizosphaerae]
MIVTLTPNPSLDRALDVDRLVPGEVLRADAVHVHPGGKGINVTRALVRHGVASRAVLPAGGADGARLVELLASQGVPALAVPVAGDTRTNITIAERSGATTKVNAPGPALAPGEVTALLDALAAVLDEGARGLVAAGSLPAGAGDDLFVRVAALAAQRSVPFALDTSGDPLACAARAGVLDLLKPNDEELAALVGRELVTVGDVVDAAREVIAAGTAHVLVSLGAHGALLVTEHSSWWAGGTPLVPLSTVGAGDMTLAGFLSADGSAADRLRTAVAWGRAAVRMPGTAVPDPSAIDTAAVRVVEAPDPRLTPKEL